MGLLESCGYGHSSAGAECPAGHLDANSGLIPFVFAPIHHPHDTLDDAAIETLGHDCIDGAFLLDVLLKDGV